MWVQRQEQGGGGGRKWNLLWSQEVVGWQETEDHGRICSWKGKFIQFVALNGSTFFILKRSQKHLIYSLRHERLSLQVTKSSFQDYTNPWPPLPFSPQQPPSSTMNYNPDDLHPPPVSASTLCIDYLTLQHAQSLHHSQWLTMPASLTYTPELFFMILVIDQLNAQILVLY